MILYLFPFCISVIIFLQQPRPVLCKNLHLNGPTFACLCARQDKIVFPLVDKDERSGGAKWLTSKKRKRGTDMEIDKYEHHQTSETSKTKG